MSKHNIRLKDIAEELGLSVPSVSRALNNKPDIGEETKKKVFELAEKLHYQRNQFAINFKNQQSFIIGVIIPQIVHHFFSNVISGIINEAEKLDYSVMLFQSNESYEAELKGVDTFQHSMIDGLIISLSDNTINVDHLKKLQDFNLPVVLMDRVSDKMDAAKIVCDDFRGAYIATEHLINLGRKKIAHLAGLEPHTAEERFKGFETALKDHNIKFYPELYKKYNLSSIKEGYDTMLELLEENLIPDAIFCVTDPVAVGAMKAIKEKNLNIPDDIAVIGFSDWEMSSLIDPPLSSVKQPNYEMGKKAVKLIVKEIEMTRKNKPIQYKTHVMETSLVLRESTVGKKTKPSELNPEG